MVLIHPEMRAIDAKRLAQDTNMDLVFRGNHFELVKRPRRSRKGQGFVWPWRRRSH